MVFKPTTLALWYSPLLASEDACRHYWPLLDTTEHTRAGQFAAPTLKYRYVEVRGRLRCLLSHYLGQPPEQINIQTTEYGKPYLADFPDWEFNLSHTGNHLLIALGQCCRLGVDLERCKSRNSLPQMAAKCFAANEVAYWQKLDQDHQVKAFYQFWTIKEAFVKATGRGIALGLKHCVIDLDNLERFSRLPDAYMPTEQWRISTLQLPSEPDLCAALVTDQTQADIEWHTCQNKPPDPS